MTVLEKLKNNNIKIYVDYNILEPLQNSLDKNFDLSKPQKFRKEEYFSLIKIWDAYKRKYIHLIRCEDDCLMEFMNFNKNIDNYNKVKEDLSANPKR